MSTTGTGIFGWDATERRTDRYGSFTLDKTGYSYNGVYDDAKWDNVEQLEALVGKRVKIEATVIVDRDSAHIGDLSRKIFPSRPVTGETIVLGIGKFFISPASWSASQFSVGVEPDDGRANDWIEPVKLYRLHDQTVTITITETNEEALRHDVGEAAEDNIIFSEDENGEFYQYKGNAKGVIFL